MTKGQFKNYVKYVARNTPVFSTDKRSHGNVLNRIWGDYEKIEVKSMSLCAALEWEDAPVYSVEETQTLVRGDEAVESFEQFCGRSYTKEMGLEILLTHQ